LEEGTFYYYFYFSLILLLCAINPNLNIFFFQGSSKDKIDLLIVKFLGNLCVLYVLNPLSNASQWNARMHNCVVLLTNTSWIPMDVCICFMTMILGFEGCKSLLIRGLSFHIHSKWVIVNNLHWTNLKSNSKKVTF
jgi:hypothetical protein